jgi:hypothetical protein
MFIGNFAIAPPQGGGSGLSVWSRSCTGAVGGGVAGFPRPPSDAVMVRVVLSDLDLALTFLEIARTARDAVTRRRNRENARKVYETMLRFRPRLLPTPVEDRIIQQKLAQLKDGLDVADLAD